MRADLENLEAVLGRSFLNRDLLVRALTHSSRVHESLVESPEAPAESGGTVAERADNERMEFLGDAVLGFLVSEALVARFPTYPEGRLSKLKAHLVSSAHLFDVARKLELGPYLILGRGEEMSGGRDKRTLLVDCLEALIAAVYLDGGIEVARDFVNRWILGEGARDSQTLEQELLGGPTVDFKSALQELAQARKLPQPRYVIVKERGPEHSKTFTIEVRVGRDWIGQAEGLSKKSAAQNAAREVLTRILEELPAANDPA
jgi:ribonuclease-3